jgi:hypothetical protein
VTLLLVVLAAGLLIAARLRRRRGAVSRGRARALVLVTAILGLNLALGGPALAQPGGCMQVPNPERPGDGMVGALDPSSGHGEGQVDVPGQPTRPASTYLLYGYAGMVWYVYDDDCGPLSKSITDPATTIDTWAGNELFNIGKNIVGATNSLHYTLLEGGVLGGLNDQFSKAADTVFNNIYMQLFSLFALLLAVLMFRQIWRGDLAAVSRRALFALGGIWLAASTFVLVGNYNRIDDAIVDTTTGIQAGFVNPDEGRIQREILPTELHNKVVYENWLRGEFGSPGSPQADQFGRRLLSAQAWNWDDLRSKKDNDDVAENAKKEDYKKIAAELGSSSGYFKGSDGSRIGTGFLAFLQAVMYSLFPLFAKLAVLLAQLLLRVLTLTAPIIGLVALIHHDVLRRVGKAVGAIVLNVLILAALAGVHYRFLQIIFNPDTKLSLLTQMLLAGIVTLVFLLVGRPIRRMWQMIEMSVSAAGASMPSARGGLFSRFRGRKANQSTPQDAFWENLRDGEQAEENALAATAPSGRRPRPEAGNPVTATAERLDSRPVVGNGAASAVREPRALISGGSDAGQVMVTGPMITPGGPPRRNVLVPASRVVDTAPVTDRGWDRGEDAVVVPSRVSRRSEAFEGPRVADVEEVAGRPVHVIFRPSRGLEVADTRQPRRMPLNDGPRYTDSVVEGAAR